MLKTSFIPLNRDEFKLLREAKRLVSKEFSENLILQADDVLDQLYAFAMESNTDRLFDIFNELNAEAKKSDQDNVPSPTTSGHVKSTNPKQPKSTQEISVGSVVNGKVCTGFYRGRPVFKDE